jgi:hypothetical protein
MTTSQPIDVCITVDIEFNLNHALTAPYRRSPTGAASVARMVGERSHGLGFMLGALRRFGLPPTFFVEVFNARHFGVGEMRGQPRAGRPRGARHVGP